MIFTWQVHAFYRHTTAFSFHAVFLITVHCVVIMQPSCIIVNQQQALVLHSVAIRECDRVPYLGMVKDITYSDVLAG